MIRFLVSVLLALAALVGAYILEGGPAMGLLAFSGALITVFVPFFGALAVWSFREWTRAWGHAFKASEGAPVSVAIWKFQEFASYLAGVLASLVGGVLIMGNLEGSDAVHIGRAFGVLLVAPTYGVLLGYVCRILRARVETLNPAPEV